MNRNTDYIPFSKPCLGTDEEKAVCNVLKSGWLTTGKETIAFEKEFASFLDVPWAIALNSGTAGLHLSLEAVGVNSGSFVVTTPYTFTASAEIIRYLDADPLFVDIDEHTYNIDPDLIENVLKKRSKKISAILPVHIAGYPCEMDRIEELSKRYTVPVVEDAAHAFPVKCGTRYTGTIGTTGIFSFYANKTITTGEGGMVVTGNSDIADRIKIMRLHGMDREAWDRYICPETSWYYDVVEAGYKYNLTDLAASIGRVQLGKAVMFLEKRKKIAQRYNEEFMELDFLELPSYRTDHAWHLYLLKIVPEKLTITRDQFIIQMKEAGIGTSVHFIPLHLMSYYKKQYDFKDDDFPHALKNYLVSFSIPIYPDLSETQVERIINTIKEIGLKAYKTRQL
ncbi:MAG: DegT/DnrJ/EryC1/StrS aminotransferase family protein [Spirochaetales bacterium]|nr:DegT/DnrJ/EryC1/StrS aminotransferase family protein [Spirochaetales bacterium]